MRMCRLSLLVIMLLLGFIVKGSAQHADSSLTAEKVLQRYIDACGGAASLQAVNDFTFKVTGKAYGRKVNIIIRGKRPGKYLQEINLQKRHKPFSKVVVLGDSIRLTNYGKQVPVSNRLRNVYKSRSQFFPELGYLSPDNMTKLELSPQPENVKGNPAYVITIATIDGVILRNYYDVKTGYKVLSVMLSGQEEDVPEISTELDDYRTVGKIKLPFYFRNSSNNKVTVEAVLKKVDINTGLENDQFK